MYRKLLKDLPEDLENYRKTLAVLKDEVIKELAEANRQKDEKLKELTRQQLEEIASEERVLDELPALRNQLVATIKILDNRLSELDLLQPDSSLRRLLFAFEKFESFRGLQRRQPATHVSHEVIEGTYEEKS